MGSVGGKITGKIEQSVDKFANIIVCKEEMSQVIYSHLDYTG